MRKKLLLIVTGICIYSVCFSQNNSLYHKNRMDLGVSLYGGPEIEISSINRDFSFSAGINGGVLIHKKLYIGVFGNTYLNRPIKETENFGEVRLGIISTGVFTGLTIPMQEKLNLTLTTKVGLNFISWKKRDGSTASEDISVMMQPQIGLEWLTHPHTKLFINAGYMFTTWVDFQELEESDMRGFTSTVGLRFGLF